MLENIDILIVGNHIQNAKSTPEIVNIAKLNANNISKIESNKVTFDDFLDFHIYGMVATIINQEIYFCGGGTSSSECHTIIDNIFSTPHCKSFNLMKYTVTTLNISLTEERTFAQSVMFENNTWFIMGGQDSQGNTSDTTEYLNANGTYFLSDSNMPEHFSRHCAKMINSSYLFTTGGSKQSISAGTSLSLSRGYEIFNTIYSFQINSISVNVFQL